MSEKSGYKSQTNGADAGNNLNHFTVKMVPHCDLVIGYQPRQVEYDSGTFTALRESVSRDGIKNLPRVTGNKIVAGVNRVLAFQENRRQVADGDAYLAKK